MFTTHRGQTRIVVVVGNVVACKFPRVRPWLAWRCFVDDWKSRGWISLLQWPTPETLFGWTRACFGGLVGNWREWRFWMRHRNAFCLPTHFSFLGLMNVQPAATALDWKDREAAWHASVKVLGARIYDDVHHFHFGHQGNWVEYNGDVRMSDYGSTVTQAIIVESGDALVEALRERS